MRRTSIARLFLRFIRDPKGVTAIEFAMIFPVFAYLFIGILEVSLLFLTTTVVDDAIQDSARMIRTGQAQLSGSAATTFQDELCGSLLGLYDCDDMTIEVKTYSAFSNINLPTISLNEAGELVDEDNNSYSAGFDPGGPGDISVVRVVYSYDFFTPLIGAVLGDGDNTKLLSATAVFRNEPYE